MIVELGVAAGIGSACLAGQRLGIDVQGNDIVEAIEDEGAPGQRIAGADENRIGDINRAVVAEDRGSIRRLPVSAAWRALIGLANARSSAAE